MIRFKPTITYGLIVVVMIWLVLGVVALGSANKWLQGSYATIRQDIIILPNNNNNNNNNNNTIINNEGAYVYEERQYNKNLVIAANAQKLSLSGLQGILYDGGLSCNSKLNNNKSSLPTYSFMFGNKNNLTKIALISRGECVYNEKLKNVQNQGASAAIIYDIDSTRNKNISQLRNELYLETNAIFIPIYYTDYKTGKELMDRLKDNNNTFWKSLTTLDNNSHILLKNDTADITPPHRVNVITLYPDQQPLLQPWQFAMIIIGFIVLLSIIIYTIIQCHSYKSQRQRIGDSSRRDGRRQRRQRRRGRGNQIDYDDDGDSDGFEISGQELYWMHFLSNNEHEFAINQHSPQRSSNDKKKNFKLHQSLLNTLPTKTWDENNLDDNNDHHHSSCVICLENYQQDDLLRILPCKHEYHRDCIDLWLTKKNACCPLCLQFVISPTIPEQVYINDTQHQNREQHIEETWYDLSNREENRLHPYANLRNPRMLHD
ncbi:unnamed protein product [Cunninghamella echinulata]